MPLPVLSSYMRTIRFYTVGCKVNQYETQGIRQRFIEAGFNEVKDGQPADIYLINTCTVTHKADRGSRYFILKARRQNPKARIIVTGCLVEKDALSLSDIKGIDFIIAKRFFPEGSISNFCGHTRAFLKIQDGCDNFCSYCKVPLVRGRSRSRPLNLIVQEAENLVKNGFKELVLCGICLGAYGRGLQNQIGLVNVIEELEKINGLLRFRLSSIEVADISNELVQKIAESQKLCRHLHIPLQSGDDEVLKMMNRKYSQRDYLCLIQKIRSFIPEIAITTDVMVGFPGESQKNFQNTVRLIKEILPLKVHIFPYSRREGTIAANFKVTSSPELIRERVDYLKGIAETCAFKYKNRFLHKEMEVLIEERTKGISVFWEGYTDNYIKILVESNQNLKNQLISVTSDRILSHYILAKPLYLSKSARIFAT